MKSKGRTLPRDRWIEAARRVLVTSGVEGVKVDRIARSIRMTRGSFYWHFKSREELLTALREDWEARNLVEIAEIEARSLKSDADFAAVAGIWLGEDPAFPAFDMAIRVWGRKSAKVAAAVQRIDDAWITLLQQVVRHLGYDETESFVRARVIYFHQIGYYALGISEDINRRLQLVPYYYRVLTGQTPSPASISVMREIAKSRLSMAAGGKGPAPARGTPGS